MTIASAFLLPHLEIKTSRSALYPPHLAVNQRLHSFLKEFGTTNNLITILEGQPDELGPFAEDLVKSLKSDDKLIKDVFYKADVEFFRDRAFLFIGTDQMEKLAEKVVGNEDKIESFTKLNGLLPVLDSFSNANPTEAFKDNLDINSAKQILATGSEFFKEMDSWISDPKRKEIKIIENVFVDQFSGHQDYDRQGYLRSHDRKMMFLFVQPASNDDDFEFYQKLVKKVRADADSVSATWKADGKTPPVVGMTGIPKQAVEETVAIKHDVLFTASVAAVLILFIILVGFRSIRRGILVFIPLVLAGMWNMGLSVLTVGHLTILTSGFTAILFGLGVDYGIFVSTRIEENLNRGMSQSDAIVDAIRMAGKTLITAGGTTAMAFFVIGTVEFTGFAELGIVAGTGVVLVILATLMVLPALATIIKLPKSKTTNTEQSAKPSNQRSRPPMVFTGFITLTALTLGGVCLYYAFQVPTDFGLKNILPKNSESMYYQEEMGKRSDYQAEMVAVIADDVTQAKELTKKLSKLSTVSRVESVTALLPDDQKRKIELMQDIVPVFDKIIVPRNGFEQFSAEELTEKLDKLYDIMEESQERAFAGGQKEIVAELDKIMNRLEDMSDKLAKKPEALQRVRDFEAELFKTIDGVVSQIKHWSKMGPIKAEDLPPSIIDRFKGKNGKLAIFVFPNSSIYDVDFLDKFLGEVYAIAPDATGFPSTHQVFSRLIMEGFVQATTYATIVVLLLLLLDFRRIGYTLAAALPLLLGSVWMLGGMYFFRIPHNYANIIALPLIIGLAVDYGVFITHRLRENQELHPFTTMEKTARPIILAALTTLAGIGAIVMGDHQGAASLGRNLICGIFTCLFAAIVVLPSAVAFLRDLTSKKSK